MSGIWIVLQVLGAGIGIDSLSIGLTGDCLPSDHKGEAKAASCGYAISPPFSSLILESSW